MKDDLYLVIGLGKTGYSIARYLQRRNMPFIVFDTRSSLAGLENFKQEFPSVEVFLQEVPQEVCSQLVAAITSPGVDVNLAEIQKITNMGIPLFGDIECFAREVKVPVIAITGTNGKSTVTTLVGEMAKKFGLEVAVAGNIGNPVLDVLDDGKPYSLWVLELSSFQLSLTYSLKPIVATLLNISEDHLDRHGSFENYVAAKQRVYDGAEFLLFNRDDELTIPKNVYDALENRVISYGLDAPNENEWGVRDVDGVFFIAHGKDLFLSIDSLKIKGRHNLINAIASCALAHLAGISDDAIKAALQEFRGLDHRTQLVRTLNGVHWINDSKGTNVGATIAAISGLGESIKGAIILIAGGQGKGADFTQLRIPVKKYVKTLILIGEDADIMEQSLTGFVSIIRVNSLDEAVSCAFSAAIADDLVLLSPACASFDMFRDFNHRGESFATLVENL